MVGYDDREIAQFMRPPLTTMVLPHHEMGMQAAATLIDGDLRPEGRQPQIKVECPLVERDSVGPPVRDPELRVPRAASAVEDVAAEDADPRPGA